MWSPFQLRTCALGVVRPGDTPEHQQTVRIMIVLLIELGASATVPVFPVTPFRAAAPSVGLIGVLSRLPTLRSHGRIPLRITRTLRWHTADNPMARLRGIHANLLQRDPQFLRCRDTLRIPPLKLTQRANWMTIHQTNICPVLRTEEIYPIGGCRLGTIIDPRFLCFLCGALNTFSAALVIFSFGSNFLPHKPQTNNNFTPPVEQTTRGSPENQGEVKAPSAIAGQHKGEDSTSRQFFSAFRFLTSK